ncbi:MAG: hypothetical protein BGO10_07490 [Chlamydia sp. 32-24]|nr:MAG: hypothetical protein BGO10_07490 [Chlamydia sp. 32-24]
MILSNNIKKVIRIGLMALFATTSLLHSQLEDGLDIVALSPNNFGNNPDPANLLVEWTAGATGLDLIAQSTLKITNNDPSKTLNGGSIVNGEFVPDWKIYFNQPYAPTASENKISIATSDTNFDYYVLTPTQNFGSIPPGGSLTFSLQAGSANAVIFSLFKTSKSACPLGLHLTYKNNENVAHYVPIKSIVDVNNPAVMSRLPLEFAGLGIVDAVPADTPNNRYAEGTPDLTVSLQKSIVPNPTYLSQSVGTFDISTIRGVQATSDLANEKKYLKNLLNGLYATTPNSSRIRLKIADQVIPNLPSTASGVNVPESYMLTISENGIEIAGADAAGVFYGIQTLRQLIFQAKLTGSNNIPYVVVCDAPRFPLRGNLLDVGRHFVPFKDLLKYIDLLAMFKINRFHLHLTEDAGWRIEIPDLPELTTYGSRRSFNPAELVSLSPYFGNTKGLNGGDKIRGKPADALAANFGVTPTWQGFEEALANFVGDGSGYYKTTQIEKMLRYAADRHIEVQLEIDLPAHAKAAIGAMEYRYRNYINSDPTKANQYRLIDPLDPSPYTANVVNPCIPSTYAFIQKVVLEVSKMYANAGVPFKSFHIGGDEVPGLADNSTWPLCSNPVPVELLQFLAQYTQIVATYGATASAWADSTMIELQSPQQPLKSMGVTTQVWNNLIGLPPGQAYDFANNDFKVLLSHVSNLYVNLMQTKNPNDLGVNLALVGTKEVFSYVPENYIISYVTTNLFGDPYNALGAQIGQNIDPVSLSRSQTALDPAKANNVVGIETALWGEYRPTYETTEYMGFPRIIAGAERSWNQNPPVSGYTDLSQNDADLLAQIQSMRATINQEWQVFANTLGKYTLPMLDYYPKLSPTALNTTPVNYKIQPPGAIIQNGQLLMNNVMPGLTLQYSLDQGVTWNTWTGSVAVSGSVLVRSINKTGASSWVEPVLP